MSFICIAGKNQIAIKGVELLLNRGIKKNKILACVNKTDDCKDSWQPSFKKYCLREEITIVTLDQLFLLNDLIFISLEFDQIINPQKFLSKHLYNIHFSKLPSYKGMYTSILPILNGEKSSGVTLHVIEKGIDTGDIIDQIVFEISNKMRGIDLYFMYLKFGIELLEKNIEKLLNSNITTIQQDSINSTYFSKKQINFSELNIDFNKTAYEIHNKIRAFTFRPYQLIMHDDISISHSVITKKKSDQKPGNIVVNNENSFEISTIDYNLILYHDLLSEILHAAEIDDLSFINKVYNQQYFLEDKNGKGWNALIVSAYNESKEVFDFLIDVGNDINTYNNNGTSLLMYSVTKACESNNTYFIKKLIDLGVNIMHKDYRNKTVYDYCKNLNNPLIYNFIKNA